MIARAGADMIGEWRLVASRISKKECFCEFVGHDERMIASQTALKILRRIVMLKIVFHVSLHTNTRFTRRTDNDYLI